MFNPIRHGTADNSGMWFAYAYPNPYGLRIPAKRCPKLRATELGKGGVNRCQI